MGKFIKIFQRKATSIDEASNIQIRYRFRAIRVTKEWSCDRHRKGTIDLDGIVFLLEELSVVSAQDVLLINVETVKFEEGLQPLSVILHFSNAIIVDSTLAVKLNFKSYN